MTAVSSARRGRGAAERHRNRNGDDRDDERGENGNERDDNDKNRRSGQKRQSGSRASLVKNKHIIEEAINVGVPHQVAYDQWTQYDEWSKIFKKESAEQKADQEDSDGGKDRGEEGSDNGPDSESDEADQTDDEEDNDNEDNDGNEVTVTAKIGPSQRQWQTEIVAQKPGRRIEWEAKGGVKARGVVTFHRLSDRLTYLQVVIHYMPSGAIETVGNFLRMPRRRVRKDLKLFKNFIELRGEATGEGPGSVRGKGLRESVDAQLQEAEDSDRDKNPDQDDAADGNGKNGKR
jgi:hypothetical protein